MLLSCLSLALASTPVSVNQLVAPTLGDPRVVVADGESPPPPFEVEIHNSPDEPVLYQDVYEILAPLTFDSGWQPSGSAIQVAIRVTAEGGAAVEMEGTGHLSWPAAVTHSQTSWEDAGLFMLDTSLVADIDLQIDLGDVYWSETLASESMSFYAEEFFTPFLLPNGEQDRVEVDASGSSTTLLDLAYDIITGVALTFRMDMRTDVQGSLEGIRKTVASPEETQLIEAADESLVFLPPTEGSLELSSIYTGTYESLLELVFTPVVGVCIDLLGCSDLAAFDIPVPLVDSVEERDFEPVLLAHEVPVMDVDWTGHDFGKVDIGDIATFELPIANAGSLDVMGGANFLGNGDFTLFPADIRAGQDEVDGIVVTFAPTVVGVQEVTLVLETNDPLLANLQIPLMGTGVEPDDGGTTVVSTENTCGCSSSPGPGQWAWLVLGLGGVLLCRRENR